MCTRFDTVHECDRGTDRHSDNTKATLMHSIVRQKLAGNYEYAKLSLKILTHTKFD